MATTSVSNGLVADEAKVKSSNILLVGAGGIGCELLKNLILSGFQQIHIIDLDTIDVSNLNRQFLFRKEHVGKSKAVVAKDSALLLNPDADIRAYHDSIMSPEYGVDFFRKFNIVMNALDNRSARSHVNRMCLAADVPLIESGTAGYLGQVTLIKKGLTECYDCQPKPTQKTFPGCTIRNTPSELIHCVVWAKHLFNQLFGESDPDQDVSPDTEDPEAAGDAGKNAAESKSKSNAVGGIERVSTRVWAEETSFDPAKLFNKFFLDDIKYLLSMKNLWKTRRPPTPLDMNNLPAQESDSSAGTGLIADQKVWTLAECVQIFSEAVKSLKEQAAASGPGSILVWDKDDEAALNFVTSAANVRAFIFGIPQKSRFDIKSMAGNIIPAIATTNAVIAGLIVLEAFKVLQGRFDLCRTVYLNRQPNPRKKLLVPCVLDGPNPTCYVCSEKPEVTVQLNVENFTVKSLEDKVLKAALGMVAPDVEIDDGKGTILISSEEGETEDNWTKTLSQFGIGSGSRLKCDDFFQEYSLVVNVISVEELLDEKEFELIGDVSKLQAKSETATGELSNGPANHDKDPIEEDDDLEIVEEDEVEEIPKVVESQSRKRKMRAASDDTEEPEKKRFSCGTDKTPVEEDLMIIE